MINDLQESDVIVIDNYGSHGGQLHDVYWHRRGRLRRSCCITRRLGVGCENDDNGQCQQPTWLSKELEDCPLVLFLCLLRACRTSLIPVGG
jgi:hypothetical protein